jgi:hypothetical protein
MACNTTFAALASLTLLAIPTSYSRTRNVCSWSIVSIVVVHLIDILSNVQLLGYGNAVASSLGSILFQHTCFATPVRFGRWPHPSIKPFVDWKSTCSWLQEKKVAPLARGGTLSGGAAAGKVSRSLDHVEIAALLWFWNLPLAF